MRGRAGERGDLEPLILVGIGYAGQDDATSYRLNRTRDYTPWHVPTGGYGERFQRVSGGAARFADFLEKQLFPWVEAEYPASADRTLVGHSYGGLFASWMLLERPHAFRRYVVASPSLWYDDAKLLTAPVVGEPGTGGEPRHPTGKAYFGVGSREINRERHMPAQMKAFVERLAGAGLADLALRSRVWEDETHNSVFPLVLSTGLRFVHEGR